MIPTREDLELYVMGEYDGDAAALEGALDATTSAILAGEARFEGLLRDAAGAATFCASCADLVRGARCDECGAAVQPGGYVVERVLVSNAHGRMYVARDADGKQVALKELAFVQSPTLAVIAAFEREAKFLRALEHPAIPRYVAAFEEGSGVHARYYLAQELVTGEPLDARLADHFYGEAELVDIARQVLGVLVYLQSVSPMVIHRDIKPANLLRRADGSIAVVDFGAAHVQGTTAGSTSIGTFGYMPIEQLAGEVDATTDPYALGASLLHLASRQEPWRIVQSNRKLDSINVSPGLRAFLAKLVAAEPRDRFATAAAALAQLDRLDEIATPAVVKRRSIPRWLRPLALAAAALAVGGASVGAYHRLRAGNREEPVVVPAPKIATLKISLGIDSSAQLHVDGVQVATVRDRDEVPVSAGKRDLEIVGPYGQRCRHTVMLAAGQTTTLECHLVQPTDQTIDDRLPPGKTVAFHVKDAQLHEVLRLVAGQCGVGLVVPDSVDGKLTLELADVACDQALEAILKSRELWYAYDKEAKVIRVAPRVELERESRERAERGARKIVDDELPRGGAIDFDFAQAPIQDLVRVMGKVGAVNIVLPDGIAARVTTRFTAVPWDRAFKLVLESHGLWYRYQANGRLVRIAPRIEIDREQAAEAAKGKRP